MTLPPPAFAGNASRVQQQQFFESLGDVPLMPGLYELFDESVVFDKPEGRIVESMAASRDVARADIFNYYNEALPQMGWSRVAPNAYVRAGEGLSINIEEKEGYRLVRLLVAPLDSKGF